jgi:hypothetical protein
MSFSVRRRVWREALVLDEFTGSGRYGRKGVSRWLGRRPDTNKE